MKWIAAIVFSIVIVASFVTINKNAAPEDKDKAPEVDVNERIRFSHVKVFIDSKQWPLAAYQFDMSIKRGKVKFVGIAGGEHAAFKEPPYYDPKFMTGERAVIAAFSMHAKDRLPTGKTAVAFIQVQVTGLEQPLYEIKLDVAATTNGKKIPAEISIEQGIEK